MKIFHADILQPILYYPVEEIKAHTNCYFFHSSLECQDFEVKITPVNKLWFGGDLVSIVGECACSDEWFWDVDDLECKRPAKVRGWLLGVIIMAVIAVIVAGIIVIYFCAYKK